MSRLEKLGTFMTGLAAGVAVLTSLSIFFSPIEMQSISASSVIGGPNIVEETTKQVSWYQAQGLWGVLVLVVFAGLYVWAYWVARRSVLGWLGVFCVGLLLLSYIAGFSIGLLYLPAVLVLSTGTGMMWLGRLMKLATSTADL